MSAVVPWLAADPARAAELLGEPREVVEHRLASLPAGSELVAPPGDGATLATGLLVLAEIPARRAWRAGLVLAGRGSRAGALPAAPRLGRGPRPRCGGDASAGRGAARAGAGAWLEGKGFAEVNASLLVRRGTVRPVTALPEGVGEAAEEALAPGHHAELVSTAFAETPFSAPVDAEDVVRQRAAPGHRADLFRFLLDRGQPAGFLQGELDGSGRGVEAELGLLPRARGRGLGGWLLRRCEALLDEAAPARSSCASPSPTTPVHVDWTAARALSPC
jgi:GNAT superfamily N-acetyltransferase